MMKSSALFRILILISAMLPPAAWASDVQTRQSVLYPFQSIIEMQEEFISGTLVNTTIGTHGWGFAGGTTTQIAGETNRYGIIRRDTGAVINTITDMKLDAQVNTVFNPANDTIVLFLTRLNNNDADTTVRVGAMNTSGANPPTNGIYLEKLSADTNWFCITRAAGVQTRTDSTVAVNTSFTRMKYTRNSSGVQFTIDSTNVCSLQTTNIPTVFLNPSVQIVNTAAAAKTLDIDYFEMRLMGITR